MMKEGTKEEIAQFILRLGVAFSFLYAAISGFISPDNWIGYFPVFLQDIFPGNTILTLWGVFEIFLGLWIFSGWKIFIPSIIGAFAVLGLIIFNFNQMDILFRDVTIILILVALAILEWRV